MSDLTIEIMEFLSIKHADMIRRDLRMYDDTIEYPDIELIEQKVYELITKIVQNRL